MIELPKRKKEPFLTHEQQLYREIEKLKKRIDRIFGKNRIEPKKLPES